MTELFKTNAAAQFLLLCVITVLGCTKVTIQSKACRKNLRNSQDSLVYNTMFFSAVAVFLGIMFPQTVPTPLLVFLASLSAVANVTFQVLYSVCLTCGPVSLTVLIANFSVLIPTVYCTVVFKEEVFITQILGIILLLISMVLSFNKTEGEQKASKKWFVLTIITLFANGFAACIQKYFYKTELANVENSSNTFLLILYCLAAVMTILIYVIKANTGKKEKCTFWFSKSMMFYAILIGFIISVFQKLFMLGTECIPGTIMYPTYYGMQSVGMGIIGMAVFKDRLSARQKLGIIIGAVSIAMMNLKLGFSVSVG